MTSHNLFAEWTTYEKVVAHDYMHHRDYFAALIDYLQTEQRGPHSMLDLGCGDAGPITPLLDAFPITKYVGIDESTEALDRARGLLAVRDIEFELVAESMETGIGELDPGIDLIIASFSMHHLSLDAKQQLLTAARSLLNAGGTFVIIDVFREPDESRAEYLDRWEAEARVSFKVLSDEETRELVDHVRSSDFPETLLTYTEMAYGAGFEQVIPLLQGPARLNRLIIFR